MYKYLRLATCASLIGYIGIVAVGGLVLLHRAVVASVPTSEDTARLDGPPASETRNIQEDASPRVSMAVPPTAENASETPAAVEKESQQLRSATEHTATSSPQLATSLPQLREQKDEPEQAVRRELPRVEDRHLQTPAPNAQAKTKARDAARKTAQRAAEKRRRNEALNSVRRFGDRQRDVPANAYAADGMRHTIPIRPTSIQDVYYYSVPR
ncbi:MAG: hypothetical protein E6G96_19790 [Alphaproteobacteria bacterium]|nr:MAG: hypothetical protein E6G96_19790 [Alphaproteobacteria bacterium]